MYCDVSYFTKKFKKRTGFTPREYCRKEGKRSEESSNWSKNTKNLSKSTKIWSKSTIHWGLGCCNFVSSTKYEATAKYEQNTNRRITNMIRTYEVRNTTNYEAQRSTNTRLWRGRQNTNKQGAFQKVLTERWGFF